MCVTNTRETPSSSAPPGPSSVRQAAAISRLCTPVSTIAQRSPSRTAQRLMWSSENGSGMRSQSTPGAISRATPGSGSWSKGYSSTGLETRSEGMADSSDIGALARLNLGALRFDQRPPGASPAMIRNPPGKHARPCRARPPYPCRARPPYPGPARNRAGPSAASESPRSSSRCGSASPRASAAQASLIPAELWMP